MKTFEEYVAASARHAEEAERWLNQVRPDPGTIATAQAHATLASAYADIARLARLVQADAEDRGELVP